MKRKLLVTLVASALELYAATAGAQSCNLVGNATSASGATAITTGPLNPIDGFPETVTDSNSLTFKRCLDPNFCFFDPIVATDPFSLQIGSGGEAFYWSADAQVTNAAGDGILTLVMAAETAFLEEGPNAEPIDGSQFPFLRLRFVMGVPADGTYTVQHPYGINKFVVTGATGARDVFATIDSGFAPNSTMTGPVGPFLVGNPAFAPVPVGFVGDMGPAGVPTEVLGAPCSTPADIPGDPPTPWNFVEVTGVDANGFAIDLGNNEFALRTTLFAVQGQLHDGRYQTPLSADRLTYSRTALAGGQIDSFATSTSTATVTVQDGPTIPVGSSKIPNAVTLDKITALNGTDSINSASVVVTPDASALPPVVKLTATDASPLSDVTSFNVKLIDFVDIAVADYDPETQLLLVSASSGDQRLNPTLTLRDFGDFVPGVASKLVTTSAPPAVVHVDSAAGGTATAQVRVVKAILPAAPTGLAVQSTTASTVTVSWTANSTNVASFSVYSVDGTTRTFRTTVDKSASTAVIRNLDPGTTYTFVVDADSLAGSVPSLETVSATTLALPVAPSGVSATTTGAVARTILVSWVDNSTDETSFKVERSTSAAFTTSTVVATGTSGAAPGSTVTAVDTFGPPALNTTYFYRVTTVRDLDSSAPVASAAGVLTPNTVNATPTHNAATAVGLTSATINWTDTSSNEIGFQVSRSTAGGPFVVVADITGSTAGTGLAKSFTNTGLTAGTTYTYRIDAYNWAGVRSSVTRNVTTLAPVPTPTTLTAAPQTAVGAFNLAWTNVAGESGYLLEQSINSGATWTQVGALTGVNVVTRNITGLGGALPSYQFRVTALSAAGAAGQSAPRTLVLPGLVAPATFTIVRGGNNNVRWTDSSGVESAYQLQRSTNGGTTWTTVSTVTSTAAQRVASNGARTLRYNMPAGAASFRMVPVWGTTPGTPTAAILVN